MTRKKPMLPADCMPRCASCAFFLMEPKEDVGECRRLPPQVFSDGDDGLGFSFSLTTPDKWCGEFKRMVS